MGWGGSRDQRGQGDADWQSRPSRRAHQGEEFSDDITMETIRKEVDRKQGTRVEEFRMEGRKAILSEAALARQWTPQVSGRCGPGRGMWTELV